MRAWLPAVLLLSVVALTGCLKDLVDGSDGPGPRDYLSSADYTRLVIEIDTVEGMDPPTAALETLRDRLVEVVDKPQGVELRKDDTLRPRGSAWGDDDVLAAARASRDIGTGGDTVVLQLLFVDSEYEEGRVLGATYSSRRGDTVVATGPIVIFSQTIEDVCSDPLALCLNPTQYWTAVLVHEFGHALGLVNNGVPMQRDHEDEAHPGHSSSTASVMYWEVETANIANVFRNGGPPTTFDADDKADLCSVSGRC